MKDFFISLESTVPWRNKALSLWCKKMFILEAQLAH
jgi:hypothetical protein